jgi:hypothetical protein
VARNDENYRSVSGALDAELCRDLSRATRRGSGPHCGGVAQPAPLSPVVDQHPIVVFAGGASHPIAFARHYAPNLAVSTKDIARLWIDSWIAVRSDHLRHISVLVLVITRRPTGRADRSPEKSLPTPRRLLAPRESLLRREANRPSPNLVDRPAVCRVPRRACGLVLRGKANQSVVPSSQHEPASGSPPAITVPRAELERKGAGRWRGIALQSWVCNS